MFLDKVKHGNSLDKPSSFVWEIIIGAFRARGVSLYAGNSSDTDIAPKQMRNENTKLQESRIDKTLCRQNSGRSVCSRHTWLMFIIPAIIQSVSPNTIRFSNIYFRRYRYFKIRCCINQIIYSDL